MRKADNIKLLFIISISFIVFLSGCVDTSVQPIQSQFDFRSQVKIVNLAAGTGSATVTIDMTQSRGTTIAFGAVAFGEESPANGQPFSDIPAGAKTFKVTYANGGTDNFKLVTETDFKMRLFIVSDTANSKTLVKAAERYIWQGKGTDNGKDLYPADTAQLAFINGCPDVEIAQLIFHGGPTDTTVELTKGAFQGGIGYQKVKAGNYTVDVVDVNGTTIATLTFNGQSQGRYTAVIYDRLSSLKNKIFTDD